MFRIRIVHGNGVHHGFQCVYGGNDTTLGYKSELCGNLCCWIFRLFICCDRELSLKRDRIFASGTSRSMCGEFICSVEYGHIHYGCDMFSRSRSYPLRQLVRVRTESSHAHKIISRSQNQLTLTKSHTHKSLTLNNSDSTGTARCADGYYGNNGQYVCNPTTLQSETTMSCLEINCAELSLPQGMVGTNNCSDGRVLSTISSPSCEVSCVRGYQSIGEGIARCPIDATFGQAVEISLQCVPLVCDALSIPSYASSSGGTCTTILCCTLTSLKISHSLSHSHLNQLTLKHKHRYANDQEGPTSCTLFCAPGYTGLGGVQ